MGKMNDMKQLVLFTMIMAVAAATAFGGRYQTKELTGRTWKLVELGGKAVGETCAQIRFEEDGKRFTGNAGCNRMFGTAEISKRKLRISNVGTTKMMCGDAGTMDVENGFLNALDETRKFYVKGDELRLKSGDRLLARFEAQMDEAEGGPVADTLALEDRKWVLESIGETAVPKLREEAFIVFDDGKRSAGGNTSCNVFGGSYETNGDKLKLSEMISTMRACVEDNRMEIERGFMDALRSTNRYDIVGDKLRLFHDKKLLLVFNGTKKQQ